tara:strand:- start:669 stop:1784 length:1116 start_codon:yes stop_codon:yes gene_type:complete
MLDENVHKVIPISQPSITDKEIEYVTDAIKSGWVSSLGSYIDDFERGFAKFCNTEYALVTSNGTTALHLSLVALGIGPGDEVIIPDFTFVATANAVKYTGAEVITVDVQEDTLCVDPSAVEKAITTKTKAIIPVHMYGHPADMSKINLIAKKNNLFVVEDCAEAHGAEIQGKKVGVFGDVGTFSFYGNKIMTSGEGGMVTTNNKELYQKMKFLRDHAMSKDRKYWHEEVGFNYRMTNLQAALGLAQLERIEELLAKKNQIFRWYEEGLKGIQNIKLNIEKEGYKNVYWLVCLEVIGYDEPKRDELINRLKKKGIDSRPFFYPMSQMPMYANANTPVTHKIFQRGLNLPSYFDLTKKDVDRVVECVTEIMSD